MIGSDKLILNKSKETTNKILGGSLGNELDRAIIVEEDAHEDKDEDVKKDHKALFSNIKSSSGKGDLENMFGSF